MKDIYPIISTLSVDDARSSLYYLCRYIKQASIQKVYEKDIFDDDRRSAPSNIARATTLNLIAFIENLEGMTASEFDEDTFHYWIDHTIEIEDRLDPAMTSNEFKRAEEFLNSMPKPKLRE